MIMIKMIVKKMYKHKNNSEMQHEKDEINAAKKKKKEEEKIPTI